MLDGGQQIDFFFAGGTIHLEIRSDVRGQAAATAGAAGPDDVTL